MCGRQRRITVSVLGQPIDVDDSRRWSPWSAALSSRDSHQQQLDRGQPCRHRRRPSQRVCVPGGLVVVVVVASYGGRSFAYAGPSNWNSLHAYLRDSSLSLSTFKHRLKTFLFSFYF